MSRLIIINKLPEYQDYWRILEGSIRVCKNKPNIHECMNKAVQIYVNDHPYAITKLQKLEAENLKLRKALKLGSVGFFRRILNKIF